MAAAPSGLSFSLGDAPGAAIEPDRFAVSFVGGERMYLIPFPLTKLDPEDESLVKLFQARVYRESDLPRGSSPDERFQRWAGPIYGTRYAPVGVPTGDVWLIYIEGHMTLVKVGGGI